DWVWVSASYTWVPAGCIFVEGHWDYPLRERGLLFAPVAFAGQVAPATRYVPRYVVREECLLGSLFVRPTTHHYYFGDYFEQRYEKRGTSPGRATTRRGRRATPSSATTASTPANAAGSNRSRASTPPD